MLVDVVDVRVPCCSLVVEDDLTVRGDVLLARFQSQLQAKFVLCVCMYV